jgi:hypothetical protein
MRHYPTAAPDENTIFDSQNYIMGKNLIWRHAAGDRAMRPNYDSITQMHIFLAVECNKWEENRACFTEMAKACRSSTCRTDGSETADAFPERANYIAGTS